jgi:death on curing protein
VTLAEALRAHERALTFGGLAGIRDRGSIESAIARPYSGYYRSIEKKAAALVQSLAQNHGFVDGNKRTAVLMLFILLVRSGYTLRFRDDATLNHEIEEMILSVVGRTMDRAACPLDARPP